MTMHSAPRISHDPVCQHNADPDTCETCAAQVDAAIDEARAKGFVDNNTWTQMNHWQRRRFDEKSRAT